MLKNITVLLPIALVSVGITACSGTRPQDSNKSYTQETEKKAPVATVKTELKNIPVVYEKRSPKKVPRKQIQKPRRITQNFNNNSFNAQLSNAALSRLNSKVRYDGSYLKIGFPGGDVPSHIGVCTDVVIRSYRKLGIDLQEQVHRDMSAAFHTYPNPRKWGLSKPDTNIDHRRVYNLRQFFQRRGAALPITRDPRNYKPGDLVTWMVGPDLPHIGVVVNRRSKADPNRYMIVHNIAHGPQMEDILFAFPITGHYRYTPAHMNNIPARTIYTQNRSPRRGMSQAELITAANILGTGTQNIRKTSARTATTNNPLLDQVVQLNSQSAPVVQSKDASVKLANLSDAEIQQLLAK